MDSTLQSLGGILLKAIPTLVLLLILHVYLKSVFFKPLQAVLEKRRALTEGAREAAEASLKRASERAAEYEAKLKEARASVYTEQEAARRKWTEEQAAQTEQVRGESHETVKAARAQLAQDVEAAKHDLQTTAGQLADQISDSLLKRRAS